MASFVFSLFSIFLSSLLLRHTSAQCSGSSFFRHSNSKLTCGVFNTVAADWIECQKQCSATLNCFSINIYRADNGTEMCDLIQNTKETSLDRCIIHQDQTDHYELTEITSCSSGQCKKDENHTRAALPKGWYQLGQYKYKLFRKLKTWVEANQTCSGHGGTLANINKELELKFIVEVLTKQADAMDSMSPKYYWKLDGTDSDVNLSGGTLYKSYTTMSPRLEFPGTPGSFATTPAIDVLHSDFTIAVWIKPNMTGLSYLPIYGYWQNPYILTLFLEKQNTGEIVIKVDMRRKSNALSSMIYTSGGKVPNLSWTHVVLTWERSTGKAYLYQNGQQVVTTQASSPEDLPAASRPTFDIGLKRDSDKVYRGWITHLAVFDRVLNVEDINKVKDMRFVWVGKTHGFINFANNLQSPDSPCVSLKTIGIYYKMDKNDCTAKMQFICKR